MKIIKFIQVSLLRVHGFSGFYIFISFQACQVACHPKALINSGGNLTVSLFCIAYQRPLVIEHGLNIRLNNKTS